MRVSHIALVVKNPPANAGDIKDAGSIPGLGRSPGGGHDNPLQYSCLQNPIDRGTWRVTVHMVTKSQTWWKRLSMHAWLLWTLLCARQFWRMKDPWKIKQIIAITKKKISESLSSQSCPLGRRTHCQRQHLIATGVCQARSHLKAFVSAAPSARNLSPHGFPWPTLWSHLLQKALSAHPMWSSPCQSLLILFPCLICFVAFITSGGPLVYSVHCLLSVSLIF